MKEFKITKKHNNKKICSIILSLYPNLSINTLNKALRQKDIRVNNIRISENIYVKENDLIKIYISDDLLLNNSHINIANLVVYEDNNIIIINKPENLSVTSNNIAEESLNNLLIKYANNSFIPMACHRIDRNTKGLVVFAKNQTALEELNICFKERYIEKYYKCIVSGIPQIKHDTLTAYLFKDSKKSKVYISNQKLKGYEEIKTNYSVLETYNNNTALLEVNLLTGKTHQIRAHLAYIGHPIIGDGKYGIGEINKTFNKKTQQLIAYKLIFHTSTLSLLKYLDMKIIQIDAKF